MAATRSTSRRFLESHGIRFMSPREGGSWALGALSSKRLEPELILLPPASPTKIQETRAVDLSTQSASSFVPALVDAVIPLDEMGWVVRWRFDPEIHAPLLEHRVAGKTRLPAAHLVEQIAEAAQAVSPNAHVIGLENVEILAPVTLTGDRPRDLFVELFPIENQMTYRARMWTHPVLPDGTLVPNRIEIAKAVVIGGAGARERTQIELKPRDLKEFAPEALAGEIRRHGIHYGPHFQGIRSLATLTGYAYAAELRPVASAAISGEVFLDVALLDLALQTLGVVLVDSGGGLPTGFDRVKLHCQLSSSPARAAWALGGTSDNPGVVLVDSDGVILAEVHGLRIARSKDVELARI
jgi:hypothetical protein